MEDAIPDWKIDDFLRFPGFSWIWVVFRAAREKKVETKRSYTPPLGGKKTQAFLVAPPKGSFVGWLVIWNFNFNRRSKSSISTGEVGSRHSFRASQMSEKFDRSSLEIFSYPRSKILVRRKLSSCRMSKILGCRKLSKRSCKIV